MSPYAYFLLPEAILLVMIVLLVIVELFLPPKHARFWMAWLALGAVVAALGSLFYLWVLWHQLFQGDPLLFWQGAYLFDSFGAGFKSLLLMALIYVLLYLLGSKEQKETTLYYPLLLTAGLGAMIMVSTFEGITILIGLEMFSIATYVLLILAQRSSSAKHFTWRAVLSSGVGTAVICYGFSFLYGITGSTHLLEITNQLPKIPGDYLLYLYLSAFLLIAGFALKSAWIPFHNWFHALAKPTFSPFTLFWMTGSQIVLFGTLLRFLLWGYQPLWQKETLVLAIQVLLMVISLASIFWGHWQAYRQQSVKQLLLYLGMGQWGFVFMPMAFFHLSQGDFFIQAIFFALVVYLLVMSGAYTIVSLVTERAGTEEIRALAGLGQQAPGLALAFTLFLLSVAGFPLTAGFIGRFLILSSNLVSFEGLVVTALAMLTTLLAIAACFRLIRQMYLRPQADSRAPIFTWPLAFAWLMSLVATFVLAFIPDLLLQLLSQINW